MTQMQTLKAEVEKAFTRTAIACDSDNPEAAAPTRDIMPGRGGAAPVLPPCPTGVLTGKQAQDSVALQWVELQSGNTANIRSERGASSAAEFSFLL